MKKQRFLTDKQIFEIAAQFSRRGDWRKADFSTYCIAKKRGIFEACCAHMKKRSAEDIKKEAMKYGSRNEWYKKDKVTYSAAQKMGILKECCNHMEIIRRRLSNDEIMAIAKQFNNRKEWCSVDHASYGTASNRGLLEVCCEHMTPVMPPHRTKRYWTLNMCKEEALKHKHRTCWQKASKTSYYAARQNNWLEECCGHMVRKVTVVKNKKKKWDPEVVRAIALRYDSVTAWRRGSYASYTFAYRQGLNKEFSKHMKHSGNRSVLEKELLLEIRKKYPSADTEIDIFIPELNKGIEFDGGYWHGAGFKKIKYSSPEEYHQDKDFFFKNIGIGLIHIKEEDWRKNKEACVETALSFLDGKNE